MLGYVKMFLCLINIVDICVDKGKFFIQGTVSNHSVSIVQELFESQGGRPGLSVLTSLLVSVDVKIY